MNATRASEIGKSMRELSSAIKNGSRGHNEACTSQAYITWFFENLGWDKRDISQWAAQERIGRKHADQVLIANGARCVVIEEKRMGTPLGSERIINQVSGYFDSMESVLAILSNGEDYWFFGRAYNAKQMDKCPMARINIHNIDIEGRDAFLLMLSHEDIDPVRLSHLSTANQAIDSIDTLLHGCNNPRCSMMRRELFDLLLWQIPNEERNALYSHSCSHSSRAYRWERKDNRHEIPTDKL